MDVLHPRCCGLDVHNSSISACILLREAGRVQKHQCRFGAMTQDLHDLAEWLRQFGVTQVAMESSGVYWKPVWNIREGQFTVVYLALGADIVMESLHSRRWVALLMTIARGGEPRYPSVT